MSVSYTHLDYVLKDYPNVVSVFVHADRKFCLDRSMERHSICLLYTSEKPPKANWLFAFAGAVILAGAYYLAVKIIDP